MDRTLTVLFVAIMGFSCLADQCVSEWLGYGEVAFDDSLCYSYNEAPMPLVKNELSLLNGNPTDGIACVAESRSEEEYLWLAPTTNDFIVVGDVTSVNLISITGFDAEIRFGMVGTCVAWYRIGVKIRKTAEDGVNIGGFSFPVSYVLGLPDWPFYRGTTFEFRLRRNNNRWRVCSCEFVHPYPPFHKQGMTVLYSGYESESREIISLSERYGIGLSTNEASMVIRYSDGNVALYRSGRGILANRPRRNVFDFSNARMYLKEGAKKVSYWNKTWLWDVKIGDMPYLTRLTAEKGSALDPNLPN